MFLNILVTFAEFEVDLLRLRTEGMAVARAKGKLKGKQPKLTARQQAELARMHATGEYTIAALMEVFSVGRATVYCTLERVASVRQSSAAFHDQPAPAFRDWGQRLPTGPPSIASEGDSPAPSSETSTAESGPCSAAGVEVSKEAGNTLRCRSDRRHIMSMPGSRKERRRRAAHGKAPTASYLERSSVYVNAPQSQNSHPARTMIGITAPSVEPTLPGSAVPSNAWEKAVARRGWSDVKPVAKGAGVQAVVTLLRTACEANQTQCGPGRD